MRDLGTLGRAESVAYGINDAGQVVGDSDAGGIYHAFITGAHGAGMIDLNSLVELPNGVHLSRALDMNNAGQVIAVGAVPEPEIFVLLISGMALIGFAARRKKMISLQPLV